MNAMKRKGHARNQSGIAEADLLCPSLARPYSPT